MNHKIEPIKISSFVQIIDSKLKQTISTTLNTFGIFLYHVLFYRPDAIKELTFLRHQLTDAYCTKHTLKNCITSRSV